MSIRPIYAYVILEVSRAAYDEIARKLRDVQYDHVFSGDTIDMHGIALEPEQHVEFDPKLPVAIKSIP